LTALRFFTSQLTQKKPDHFIGVFSQPITYVVLKKIKSNTT